MTIISDYIARMIEAGMDQSEAMQIAAEIFAAGAASAAVRPSPGALRTRKWRAKQPSQSVTSDAQRRDNEGVTNRHKPSHVTLSDDASLSIEKKEEEKKERKRESRASQLPPDWRPDDESWQASISILGNRERAEYELGKFTDHALEKGRIAKNWNAAWRNWAKRAVEYGGKNGNRTHHPAADQSRSTAILAGVAAAAERRFGSGGSGAVSGSAAVAGRDDPDFFGTG